MTRSFGVLVCAVVVLITASSADARNRLFRVLQEPIPEPRPEVRTQQELLAPAPTPVYPPAPSQSTQKLPFQRLAPQKYSVQKAPVQHGVLYAKTYQPHIRYVQHCPRRTCCGHGTSINTVLTVKNPRTHCVVNVPVCLPGCCHCAPSVHGHAGIFGRGVTAFHWPCGYKIRVVFDHRGDVTVHYFGT